MGLDEIRKAHFNGDQQQKLACIINISFDDVGSDEIEDGILVTGPAATFSMDVKMLGEFLRQVKMDKIRIQTKAADTVVDFWASETFRYLQMPTRPKPAPAPAA